MVVAAAGHLESLADAPHAVARALGNGVCHLEELSGGLVPRMIAAFFKMSFSA